MNTEQLRFRVVDQQQPEFVVVEKPIQKLEVAEVPRPILNDGPSRIYDAIEGALAVEPYEKDLAKEAFTAAYSDRNIELLLHHIISKAHEYVKLVFKRSHHDEAPVHSYSQERVHALIDTTFPLGFYQPRR